MWVLEGGSQTWRLILDHVDDARNALNSYCAAFEAWQIASYTLSLVFLVLYVGELSMSERPLKERVIARLYYLFRSMPHVKRRVNEDLKLARKNMEEEVHRKDGIREFYKFIPERPITADEIVAEAGIYSSMAEPMARNISGIEPSSREEVADTVWRMFGWSNPRQSDTFPGGRKMEAELVRMCLSLFHGDSAATGVVVPSAAEATLVALSAARSRAVSQGIRSPSVVLSAAAPPSTFHACRLLGLRVREVAVNRSGGMDVGALKRAVASDTAIIIGSAPNALTGTLDPIDSISKLAGRYSIPLHVDCSLGGFVLPFFELCDFLAPSYDFRLPGVSSIAIDFSKFSQCPASVSLALFRDRSMMKKAVFTSTLSPTGIYSSISLSDSLDGSAVAAAWTTLLATGREGYVEATQRLVQGTLAVAQALETLPGIRVLGKSETVVVAFEMNVEKGRKAHEIFHVVEQMRQMGWPLEALPSPPAARLVMSLPISDEIVAAKFVDDLDTVLVNLANNADRASLSSSAAFNDLVSKAADRWMVGEIVAERALAHYSLPPPLDTSRALRTLSVEGRKMSMLASGPPDIHERSRKVSISS